MIKLVVGLGNPEAKYNWTRHNFGYLALDFYLKIKQFAWSQNPKFNAVFLETTGAELGQITTADDKIIFIKPLTYYNNSGEAVAAVARFYKIPPENILVICDDFNLEFGKLRWRAGGSDGGNNGLKSIIGMLKTENFPRLRLGTGNDSLRTKLGDTAFVTGKFTPEEKKILPEILKTVAAKISEQI